MIYNKLLKKIEEFINSFYLEHSQRGLVYPTFSHTREMVNNTEKVCRHYQLDERLHFIIVAAAWFHKTGYIIGYIESYEVKSAELAEHFMKNTDLAQEDIAEIRKCIVATSTSLTVVSLPEKIICDTNTFYYGTEKFKEYRKLLKKELEQRKNLKIPKDEWRLETIKMLETHRYQTDYCQSLLDETKDAHLKKLKTKHNERLLHKHTDPIIEDHQANGQPGWPAAIETQKPPPPEKKPTRGVETMFRISSSNSQQISMMADNKAHIMISVNSIIMSVVLGLMIGKLDENKHLIIPTIILLFVNVATIIFSILATRPKENKGVFTQEEVENKSTNLLFYGNFYNMELKEYDKGMRAMMNDREFLYGSLIQDIYWQGKVLGRKYKLLRISYNIFMFGIAAAVIAFTISTIFYGV